MSSHLIPHKCTASRRHCPPSPRTTASPLANDSFHSLSQHRPSFLPIGEAYGKLVLLHKASYVVAVLHAFLIAAHLVKLHCFAICRRMLSCALNRHSGLNRYQECRLRWVVLQHDHSARPNSTQPLKLNWVRSGTVLMALDYNRVAAT